MSSTPPDEWRAADLAAAIEATKDMDADDRDAAPFATAAQVMNTMPPREHTRINKSLDSVHASGARTASCTATATTSRRACSRRSPRIRCCKQPLRRVGFASGCRAFGNRELLGLLRSFGFVIESVLTGAR